MKKIQYIIVPALALCMFAACNTEVKGPSQAELDAQVDAKVKSATDQLKSECDSRIMTAAQLKKDSILVKLGKQKPAPVAAKPAPAPKAPVKAPVKPTPPKVEPVKVDPKKDKMSGGNATKAENLQDKKDKMQGVEKKAENTLQEKKNKMGGK